MGWDYRIAKSDLGFNICRRKKNENWTMHLERLGGGGYTLNKTYAKTFYNEDDAKDALVVVRRKWDKIPTTFIRKSESEGIKEKRSWSEL